MCAFVRSPCAQTKVEAWYFTAHLDYCFQQKSLSDTHKWCEWCKFHVDSLYELLSRDLFAEPDAIVLMTWVHLFGTWDYWVHLFQFYKKVCAFYLNVYWIVHVFIWDFIRGIFHFANKVLLSLLYFRLPCEQNKDPCGPTQKIYLIKSIFCNCFNYIRLSNKS